MQNFVD